MSVIAFRRWAVTGGGQLTGIAHRVPWPTAAPTTAGCRVFGGTRCSASAAPGHQTPSLTSKCGVWAHKQPVRPCQCGQPTDRWHGAVGAVRLWGRFVEHEHGWRAQYARPVALVDFTGRVDPRYDAARYPDLGSLYSEWAPDLAGQWAPGEDDWWCPAGWSPLARQPLAPVVVDYSWAGYASAVVGPRVPDQMAAASRAFTRTAEQFAAIAAAFEACTITAPRLPAAQPVDRDQLLADLRGRHQHGPWIDRPERSRRRR